MKILFLGGTGLISSACSALAVARGHTMTLLNRGTTAHTPPPAGAEVLHADLRDPKAVAAVLGTRTFDAVVNWIAFTIPQVEQDLAQFAGRCGQYVFISSASAYEKPARSWPITENTPLSNPYWEYSRNKAACEARLMTAFRGAKFPATIVRPSLTYGPTQIPLALGCWSAPYTLIRRARAGKPLAVPGDGTSLWVVTHHRDFAVGLVGLLGIPATAGEAFHITSDEAQSWNMIYETFVRACGAEPVLCHAPSDVLIAMNPGLEGSLRGDKSESAIFDNSKLKRFVPEYAPAIPFAVGIRETVAWFDADPARQSVDAATDDFHDRVAAAMARAAA